MIKSHLVFAVAGVVALSAVGAPAIGQSSAPTTLGGMIGICAPIIDEQYAKDDSRWGQCVAATEAYLKGIIPTLGSEEEIQTTVATTVEELVKLYRPQDCKLAQTELPQAIGTAKSFTTDEVQLAAIDNIGAAVNGCQQIATAAVQEIMSEDAVDG